jgi:hypothetical protein
MYYVSRIDLKQGLVSPQTAFEIVRKIERGACANWYDKL